MEVSIAHAWLWTSCQSARAIVQFCGRNTAQGPAHRSARQSTHAFTRSSTVTTPRSTARVQLQQPQPDSVASQSLNDLLELVQQQVRAEMQAQQAEAGHDKCMYF